MEQPLHLLARRVETFHYLRHLRKTCGARVRAVRVTEIDEHHLTAIVAERARAAIMIAQFEILGPLCTSDVGRLESCGTSPLLRLFAIRQHDSGNCAERESYCSNRYISSKHRYVRTL